jgi:hypothetical protein
MKKQFVLLVCLLLFPISVNAGAKVFLYPGTTLEQSAETDFINPVSYEWKITKGDKNIATIPSQKMSHVFSQEGRYNVALKITDQSGESEETLTEVVVGDVEKNKNRPVLSFIPFLHRMQRAIRQCCMTKKKFFCMPEKAQETLLSIRSM